MKIKMGQCRCGQITYMGETSGLRWTADPTPLDAQTAVAALVAGREVYEVVGDELKAARPATLGSLTAPADARPTVVASHPCPPAAVRALEKASVAPEVPKCPKGPERPAQGAARGRSAEPATRRVSEGPRCDACGEPCADGTYAAVSLGDIVQWAQHVDACGKP